jgi:hypothetical protein
MLQSRVYAVTYYAVMDGNWSGNIWSTTPGGVGGALPALANGDIITISNYTVTVNVVYSTAASITLNLISNSASIYTRLNFTTGMRLNFGAGSHVYLSKNDPSYLDPQINPGGGMGSSSLISVGGTDIWTTGAGPVSGTGELVGGALPIKLSLFIAAVENYSIELKWSTSSEINFDYFNVEKSTSGENFSTLAKIPGHGTSYERHDYSLIDQNPFIGKNYYRLTSIDFDGYTEVFKVIAVDYSAEKDFSVYPNPSSGNVVNFKLNYKPESGYIVAIYDNLGKVLTRLSPTEFNQSVSFDQPLTSGVYFAKLITEDFVKVERFIVN